MEVSIVLTASGSGNVRTFATVIDSDDEYVHDRMEQAGGDVLIACALAAVHTYDIFPPRQD